MVMTCPFRSTGITPDSTLLRGSPPAHRYFRKSEITLLLSRILRAAVSESAPGWLRGVRGTRFRLRDAVRHRLQTGRYEQVFSGRKTGGPTSASSHLPFRAKRSQH